MPRAFSGIKSSSNVAIALTGGVESNARHPYRLRNSNARTTDLAVPEEAGLYPEDASM